MNTKLTVIVDNTADRGLEGEWGLSILVEISGKKILVDTGKSELFADNLKTLGFDIGAVDYGVLSHAHYDHANGMPRFFKENSHAKFYLRAGAAENCYKRWKVILKKYIGLPKNVTSEYADRIEYVSGDYRLCDGVWLVPHKTEGLEAIGKREKMFVKTARGWKYDSFAHEQSVVVETLKGLVIINSCSHGGVMNIVREVQETFPEKHIYGYIGGMHLFNKSDEFVRGVADSLLAAGVDFVCTGHCTMGHAYKVMKEILGDKLCQLKVGLTLDFTKERVMEYLNDVTYIKDMKHSECGPWHQYDVLIDARGYGWNTMVDWAEYVRTADIGDVQQVTTSVIAGGNDVDVTLEYKRAGSIKAMKSLANEQGVLSIAGMSKVLREPTKIVWFNQTQVIRFFTPLNDELQIKKYAETVIRRTFGTADEMKLGKPRE